MSKERSNSKNLVVVNKEGSRTGRAVSRRVAHGKDGGNGEWHAVSYVLPMTLGGTVIEGRRSTKAEALSGIWVPGVFEHVEEKDIRPNEPGIVMYQYAARRGVQGELGLRINDLSRFASLGIERAIDSTDIVGFPNREFLHFYGLFLSDDEAGRINPKNELSKVRKRHISDVLADVKNGNSPLFAYMSDSFRGDYINAVLDFNTRNLEEYVHSQENAA